MKRQQSGSILIIVLLLLLAITVIGTYAVRQAMFSLNIATNSQAQQLLMQNSDAAFFNVEREDNIIQALSSSGMFGYISGATDIDKEMVFCYRGEEAEFFNISRASIISWQAGKQKPTNNEFGKGGYCNASEGKNNFFTSGRRVVMTQVTVKFSSAAEAAPFFGRQFGTDNQTVKFERTKPVKVFTVSVIPSLSQVSTDSINSCFSEHMSEVSIPNGTSVDVAAKARKTVTECLADLSVPFTSHVTEYVIVQDFVDSE